MEPIVITLDTKPDENALKYIKTLINRGWKFKLIGTDTEWESFIKRVEIYRNELKNLNPKQLCVITDCRDVLCVRTPLRFTEIFEEFNSKIVVSGELFCGGYSDYTLLDDVTKYNCTPLNEYWDYKGYIKENLPIRKYVNAGMVTGYAEDLISMYNWMLNTSINKNINDDQVLMGMYMNNNPEYISVDIDIKLLHTSTFGPSCGYLNRFQEKDSPTFAQVLGHSSFFIHLPGSKSNRGNSIIYEMVSLLTDKDYNNNLLLDKYGLKEENIPYKWYQEDELIEIKERNKRNEINTTFVTAFFDINRTNWNANFKRTNDTYLSYFYNLTKLNNKIILYTSEEIKNIIKENINTDNITFVCVDFHNKYEELIKKVKSIQETKNYIERINKQLLKNPEYCIPEYVVVTNKKVEFVNDAIKNDLVDTEYVCWIDFGYVRNNDTLNGLNYYINNWEDNKIHMFNIKDIKNIDINDVIFNNNVYIVGGTIIGNKKLWNEFNDIYYKNINKYLRMNVTDDDQSFLLLSYLDKPELFELHKTNDWFDFFK